MSAGTARCNGAGFNSNCAATTGTSRGDDGHTGNMADHNLQQTATDLYIRWYSKILSGYSLGAEKVLTINSVSAGSGGITIGGWGSGAGWAAMCPVYDCNVLSYSNPQNTGCPGGSNQYLCANQGNALGFSSTVGRWVYHEIHIKLNTPGQRNRLYQMLLNYFFS